jgi:hypothetical protein
MQIRLEEMDMQKLITFFLLIISPALFLSIFCRQESIMAWEISPPPSAAGYGGQPPLSAVPKVNKNTPPEPKADGDESISTPAIITTDKHDRKIPAAGGYGTPSTSSSDRHDQDNPPTGGYGSPSPASGLNISPPPAAGGYGNIYGK